MLPRRKPSIAPCAPHKTSSSAGGSLTMLISTSAAAAVSRGFAARFAPSLTNSSACAVVRFHTTSGNPAFSRLRPIGLPISPSPINTTAGFISYLPNQDKNIPARARKCEWTGQFQDSEIGLHQKRRELHLRQPIFSLQAWERREPVQLRRAPQLPGSRTHREFPRASFSLFRLTKNALARISLCPYPTPASRSSKVANRPRDNALPRACPRMRCIVPFHLSRPNNGNPPSRRLRSIYE